MVLRVVIQDFCDFDVIEWLKVNPLSDNFLRPNHWPIEAMSNQLALDREAEFVG
jgi:hypothetical protein